MATVLPFILLAFGLINLVFAFVPAPAPLRGLVGLHNQRKMRLVLSFLPENGRDLFGRLLVGGILTAAAVTMLLRAVGS